MRTRGRAQGYTAESERRRLQLMAPPKDMLRWFLDAYREEMPERIHAAGLWRDRVTGSEAEAGVKATGGSALGTPQSDPRFRLLTEASPFSLETAEYEGHKDRSDHYTFPIRAALARLAGREPITKRWGFMAHALLTVARHDGDWDTALASLGVYPEAVRRVYIETALRTLYAKYEVEPFARAA